MNAIIKNLIDNEKFKDYFLFGAIGTGKRAVAARGHVNNQSKAMNLSSSTSGIASYRTNTLS